MTILRGRAFIGGEFRDGCELTLEDGVISRITQSAHAERSLIVPGFIDVHVHGAAGSDFMDGTATAVATVVAHHARHGTTALAATTLSASDADIRQALSAIREAQGATVSEIVGVHFEGPYINALYAGAQARESVRLPNHAEFARWLSDCSGLAVIATVAPEIDGVLELIRAFKNRVVFSLGHTAATYVRAVDAITAGARHATHLFNAMSPLHHREPGTVGAVLDDQRVTAELIADLQHVHPAALRIAATTLNGRGVLITDAMRACGMPAGTYKLYAHDVAVRDGAARLADGTLAGSVLTMDAAVRGMVQQAGLTLESVIPFASEHPARVLAVDDRKGFLNVGYDADVLVLRDDLRIERVFARGTEVNQT